MKIYIVVFEWSTEDDSDVDIEAFDTYEKAALRFQERINDEKTDMSWVHEAFDENGDILDGYDFDECQPDTRLETRHRTTGGEINETLQNTSSYPFS